MDIDHTQSGAGEVAGSAAGELSTTAPSYVQTGNANGADLGQQVATDPLQYNPVNCPQQVNTSSLSTQSGTNPVQMLPNQLVQDHQMSQLHQMTAADYLKLRQQQMGMKTGGLQQLQQQFGLHPHLNSGISSPQLHQALSPQNNLTNLQQNSLSGVSTISNSPQHMRNRVQPGSSFDLGQMTMQELATGFLQQNPVNSPQQFIKSSLFSQSGTNPVQPNLGSQLLNSKQSNQLLRDVIFERQQLMQQDDLTNLQSNSLSGLPTISNRVINMVQGNSLEPLQQVATGSLQQNPVSSPQVNISSQSETNRVQANLGSRQQNTIILQQMLQTQQLQMQLMQLQQTLQQQQQFGQFVGSHHSQLNSGISSSQLNQWKEKGKVEGDVTLQMEFEPYTSTVEDGADWQEEIYQKIKSMREAHLLEINDLYQKTASKVQQRPQHDQQIEKLKIFKMTLERIVRFLWLNKHEIQLCHKEKLFAVEKYISLFLSCKRPHEPISSPLQVQLPQPSMHISQAQIHNAHQTPMMDSEVLDILSEFDRLLSLD